MNPEITAAVFGLLTAVLTGVTVAAMVLIFAAIVVGTVELVLHK